MRRAACWLGCVAASTLLLAASQSASAEPIPSASTAPAAPSASGGELVLRALGLLGVNYRFGGSTPDDGLDCSGLVRHVFRESVGLMLPRRTEDISRRGTNVALDELRPGDLVFFDTLRRAFSHVGIYIGNDRFVHAPASGGTVRIESLQSNYWAKRFNGGRRIAEPSPEMQVEAGALGQVIASLMADGVPERGLVPARSAEAHDTSAISARRRP